MRNSNQGNNFNVALENGLIRSFEMNNENQTKIHFAKKEEDNSYSLTKNNQTIKKIQKVNLIKMNTFDESGQQLIRANSGVIQST